MDAKRKDHKIMLLHHAVTIALIVLSYAYRYHRLGLMVLFCHDANDIFLEFTKCHVYLIKRNEKINLHNEIISQLGFCVFAFSWFLFRLYWFPLKVIYITSVASIDVFYLGGKLYLLFNALLCVLLLLNLYWFYVCYTVYF
jgi:ceramide synthetase